MSYSPELKGQLDAQLMPWEGVSTRVMFGCMGYFVGQRLFAFTLDRSVVAKIAEEAKPEAALAGARPFRHGPNGRFGDWMEFPLDYPPDTARLLPWAKLSYDSVRLAPPSKAARRRNWSGGWKVRL